MGLWKNSFPGAGILARGLRSPIAEMGLWWGGAPYPIWEAPLRVGLFVHRQASSLRGERDLDNLTQDRLRMVLQNGHLPWNYFCFCLVSPEERLGYTTLFLT